MKFSRVSALVLLLDICTPDHVATQAVRLGQESAALELAAALRNHGHHHHNKPTKDAKAGAAAGAADAPKDA